MQIELSVERENSTKSNLWYGLITLRSGIGFCMALRTKSYLPERIRI